MTASANPRFTTNGAFAAVRITAANTSSDGGGTIGTDIFKLCTAGANGTFVPYVRLMPQATATTTTTATVCRVFCSTVGSGATTNANTFLVADFPLSAVSADSNTTGNNPVDWPINFTVPSGSFLHVTNYHAPAANTCWVASVPDAGDY